jgi:hypothetical protein
MKKAAARTWTSFDRRSPDGLLIKIDELDPKLFHLRDDAGTPLSTSATSAASAVLECRANRSCRPR